MLQVQFLLVLSAYKTSHQWLQHPSNTVNTLCGSNLGAAQAEGYLWWPDAGNTALSYCVQACPQAAGDQFLTIRFLQHTRRIIEQDAGHGTVCVSSMQTFCLDQQISVLCRTRFTDNSLVWQRCGVKASPFVMQVQYV